MAHSLSAKKRIRQNLKRRALNRARKASVREQVSLFTGALSAGELDKAEQELRRSAHWLDKVASKGAIHKNTAARRRSRLARKLNAARAAAAAGTVTTTGKGRRSKTAS